jgi:hypothetical protein
LFVDNGMMREFAALQAIFDLLKLRDNVAFTGTRTDRVASSSRGVSEPTAFEPAGFFINVQKSQLVYCHFFPIAEQSLGEQVGR